MKNNNLVKQHKYYNNEFFAKWAKLYDLEKYILFPLRKKAARFLDLKPPKKIVDVATGTGAQAFEFAKIGHDVIGIDLSPEMLNQAKKKIPHGQFIQLSVLDLDKKFKENYFDYIFVIDAFHHFPEHKKVMKRFRAVLKYKGTLIITELDFGKVFNYLFHVLEPGNNWIYTKKAMKNIFKESGFAIKKQKNIGIFSYVTIGLKGGVSNN